jgi:hypothetical protein
MLLFIQSAEAVIYRPPAQVLAGTEVSLGALACVVVHGLSRLNRRTSDQRCLEKKNKEAIL